MGREQGLTVVQLFLAIPALAAAVSATFGIVWLIKRHARANLERRYPLIVLTWIMAVPAAGATGMALVFGLSFALDGGGGSDSSVAEVAGRFVMPVLGLVGLVSAVAVIVLAHRASSPRWHSRPWSMLAVAVVPILVVVALSAMVFADEPLGAAAGMVLALGASVNALFAKRITSALTAPVPQPPPPL